MSNRRMNGWPPPGGGRQEAALADEHQNGVSATLRAAPETPINGRGSVLCPYCGHLQAIAEQCERCRGLFEPLSRQATQNQMGPWQVRSERQPFSPGFSYEKLREMVIKGKVTRSSVVRGPSTRQFWSLACNAPGVAVLLGECHNCHSSVDPDEYLCKTCNAVLTCSTDRQYLGLAPVKLLPGEASPHEVASIATSRSRERPAAPAAPNAVASAPAAAPRVAASGPTIAARRRARRDAETLRAVFAAAVVVAVIAVTVVALMLLRRPDAGAATTPTAPAESQPAPAPEQP